ncbi:MAG: hypothetical protein HFG20_04120 [Anaerotruncus sp.]|nr:hypothetical protein [Anaerotruncus sp.]
MKPVCSLLLLLLLCLVPLQVNALEPEWDYQQQLDAIGADELEDTMPQDAKTLLEDTGIRGIDYQAMLSLSPEEFFRQICQMVSTRMRQPLVMFGAILGTILLCATLDSLKTALWDGALSSVFSAVAVVCIAAAVASPMLDCIQSTARSIQECATFITSFIPVFSSVITVSGHPVTASTYTMFLFAACQVVSQVVSNILVPLLGIYLALCITGSLSPNLQILPIAKAIKSGVSWTLGLLLTLFVGLLSVQTMVASSSDTVAAKTAKFLIGSFVPVVGSALSDAFVATQGYLKLLKTAVGAFGVLVSAATFLPVFLQTATWYLAVNLSAAVSEMLEVKQVADILKSTGTTLGILLSIILCFALLVVISTSLILIVSTGV